MRIFFSSHCQSAWVQSCRSYMICRCMYVYMCELCILYTYIHIYMKIHAYNVTLCQNVIIILHKQQSVQPAIANDISARVLRKLTQIFL